MGDRGQIKIGGVYLYTHWCGSSLKNILQTALKKRWRWADGEYLTRIIFECMIDEERNTETGYGIGTITHIDLNSPLLEIDVSNQKVIEEGWGEPNSKNKEWSFEEFIKREFD